MENKDNIDNFWESINVEPGNNESSKRENKEKIDDFWKSVEQKPLKKGPSDNRVKYGGIILVILMVIFAYVDGTFEKLNIFGKMNGIKMNKEINAMLESGKENNFDEALKHGYKALEYARNSKFANTLNHASLLYLVTRFNLQARKFDEAEITCRESLRMVNSGTYSKELDFGANYYLFLILNEKGLIEDCHKLLNKLYNLMSQIPERKAEKAMVMINLISLSMDKGETGKSEKLLKELNNFLEKNNEVKASVKPVYDELMKKINGV